MVIRPQAQKGTLSYSPRRFFLENDMEYRQPFDGSYPISQRYGEKDTDPTGHKGIDYACPAMTPILASESGQVIFAGWDKTGYGYCVKIRHSDGNVTLYAHLSQVVVYVGQKVVKSQVIGYSGSTGNSTGPHLHFEVRGPDGKAFDPATILHSTIEPSIPPSNTHSLKGAAALGPEVKIVAPAGAWGWNADFSKRVTVFPDGTELYYTGKTMQRLGYTYCECYPEPVKYWVAVNDGETQILDNDE